MATLTQAFRSESAAVHNEHNTLLRELADLDSALSRLVCYSEVFANLATAKQVQFLGKQLAEQLPPHFRREEETVLATVAEVSPELAEFAREMKRQHEQLRERLVAFCKELDRLETSEDLDETIANLKKQGKELISELGRHVALEENELSGFL